MFERFSCSECSYIHENMEVLKKHMIVSHKKDKWNWGLDIKMIFDCQECDLEFTSKSMLKTHVSSGHNELNGIVVKDVTQKVVNEKDGEVDKLLVASEEEGYQHEEEEENLTIEEIMELSKLHDEAMAPTEEEEDWMNIVIIKEERKNLKNKYLPQLCNYKVRVY